MPDIAVDSSTEFSHVKLGDMTWRSDGLHDFFLYKDLGIAAATHGKVIAHLVKANEAPKRGTGTAMKRASTSSSCSRVGPSSCAKTRTPSSPPAT